jgi:arachidonate 15-lipoxygenase
MIHLSLKHLNYPYRDDALLIWGAIHEWVSGYLSLYYPSDNDIEKDYELKEWSSELISSTGGQLKGIDDIAGHEDPLAYLTDITTQIIFTASAQHAAVNFSQVPMMSYTPAMPMAGYVGSNAVNDASQERYFEMLPPIPQAQDQFQLTYLLGSVYYTKLGDYSNLIDLEIQKPLQKFQERLEEIESIIIKRNEDHPEKSYKYLIPSKIPQSINI